MYPARFSVLVWSVLWHIPLGDIANSFAHSRLRLFLQIGRLQEHNRALDRMIKSKEAALLEAERTVQVAEAKASMVDDLQNRNQELLKQIEIYQVKHLHSKYHLIVPSMLYYNNTSCIVSP